MCHIGVKKSVRVFCHPWGAVIAGVRLECQECQPSLVLSCQPWYCLCVNHQSLGRVWVPEMTPEAIHLPVESAGSLVDFWVNPSNSKRQTRQRGRWIFVSRREEQKPNLRGEKWVGMYWHLTENWLEGLVKHSGGCSAKNKLKKRLDFRNGGRSNSEVSSRAVIPFIDTMTLSALHLNQNNPSLFSLPDFSLLPPFCSNVKAARDTWGIDHRHSM